MDKALNLRRYDDYRTPPRYKVGDRVRLIYTSGLVGLVMEVTKAVSEHGRTRYTVRVPLDPEPLYFPVHDEEIEMA